ncbi:MAG: hypothetical protein JXQ65_14050 [Candidatus Marinimicrobia bacterium]|nr:hypothetical protein [Candidatus Neomarinimicrobiota bacterium]
MKKLNLIVVVVVLLAMSLQAFAGDFRLTNKRFVLGATSLCALNETLQKKDVLTIYVLGDQNVAEELLIFKNQKIGFAKLTEVTFGQNLPAVKPDVMLICDETKVADATDYCRDMGVFSIARSTAACKNGASTAIVSKLPLTFENKYSISTLYATINKSSLFAEGMIMHAQVWNVAKPVDDSGSGKELAYLQLF